MAWYLYSDICWLPGCKVINCAVLGQSPSIYGEYDEMSCLYCVLRNCDSDAFYPHSGVHEAC